MTMVAISIDLYKEIISPALVMFSLGLSVAGCIYCRIWHRLKSYSCRISWKKNEVADSEATTFSIFYNNTLYLLLVLGLFYFLRQFAPVVYPHTHTVVVATLCFWVTIHL